MALTCEEQQNIRDILVAIYGPWAEAAAPNPTEETLELVEDLIKRSATCNAQVMKLMQDLPNGIIGKGWMKKHLRNVTKMVTKNIIGFRGCDRNILGAWRKPRIFESANR